MQGRRQEAGGGGKQVGVLADGYQRLAADRPPSAGVSEALEVRADGFPEARVGLGKAQRPEPGLGGRERRGVEDGGGRPPQLVEVEPRRRGGEGGEVEVAEERV